MRDGGIEYPDSFNDAVILSGYAVDSRYPLIAEPVTEKEYTEAADIAKALHQWIENEIERQYRLKL